MLMNPSTTHSRKPIASLSIDFDNKWAYLRAAGRTPARSSADERNADVEPCWESCDSYLGVVSERVVDVLGEFNLPLTAFIVGRDLQNDSDVEAIRYLGSLREIEYANHSLNHLPWMHTLTDEEIESEIMTTDRSLRRSLGIRPQGFRGPGFSCPAEVLSVLIANNYCYDASVFPTSIAPIARAVFLARTKLKGEQKEKAKKLYGGFASMRQPNRPFRRSIESDGLWEIPVTVLPLLRTPIHFSYLTFLAGFSTLAAKAYFRSALRLCRITGTAPSLLLHPPDFLGHEDDQDMAYFPGMKLARQPKLEFVRWALKLYSDTFDVRTMIRQIERPTAMSELVDASPVHSTESMPS